METVTRERELLAVDLGLKTGLALYGADGRLRWYRSQNFGTTARLRRGAASILRGLPNATDLVLEGGGPIAEVWAKEGGRRGLRVETVDAGTWRRSSPGSGWQARPFAGARPRPTGKGRRR